MTSCIEVRTKRGALVYIHVSRSAAFQTPEIP